MPHTKFMLTLNRPGKGGWRIPVVALLAMLAVTTVHAAPGPFRDPDDGALDLSDWLIDQKGFLPVPIIITEPAVGAGGGVALAFFRNSIRENAEQAAASGRSPTPPDIFLLAAFGTENGTKGFAGGGMVSFDDDRWRWRGGVAKVNANLDFYGIGGQLGLGTQKIGYNLNGLVSVQHALRRLGSSDWWSVFRWNYFDLKNSFDLGPNASLLNDHQLSQKSSGLGVSLEYEGRDNIFTPSKGVAGALDLTFDDPAWGSDSTFQAYRAHIFGYVPVSKVVIALRADFRAVNGEVPFYQLPFVDLRGVPLGRFQDRRTFVAETEVRWNFTPRWSLIGFVGEGQVWGSKTDGDDRSSVVSKGGGFRYLLARRLGLYAGIDYARALSENAWYLQVGSAWR